MKSTIYKHSVGLVGFLGQYRAIGSGDTPSELVALVGFPENHPKPDQQPDHKPAAEPPAPAPPSTAPSSDHATIARAKQIARAAEATHVDLIDYGTRVGAVELIYVEPHEKVTPVNPEFPPCPTCAAARYWISSLGKVVCGVCGETRFILASISYHMIN